MRALYLIFTAYLIVLAFMPCEDLVISALSSNVLGRDHVNDEMPDSDHEDHCTPFCICACCGIVLDAPPPILTIEERESLPPNGSSQPEAFQNWNSGFLGYENWQPPKFA
jgi:hypothetical protein